MKGFAAVLIVVSLVSMPLAAVGAAGMRAAVGSLEFIPLIAVAPDDPQQVASTPPACTSPAPVHTYAFYHCYTPDQMAAAYGVDALHAAGITGKGETIVIVDSYGSPTALEDLQFFSSTFGLPAPDLTILHPTGTPSFNPAMHGIQAGWAFETSLDVQWAHAIAPDAKLVLVEANPAETQGVQGFPSMFQGEAMAIQAYPGSVISQSFAVTEQSFNGATATQIARFDDVYAMAAANRVTIVSAAGDSGTANVDKQGRLYPFPTAEWPASDPLVTAAGGTWLQYGWKWNPSVSAATYYDCLNAGTDFDTCAAPYLAYTTGAGRTEAVWKEDWLPASTGGALSALFGTPSWQSELPASLLAGMRGLPDLSWNAAVDGGALVYTTFPGARAGWHLVGGTSASTPQIAGLIALANQLADQSGKQHVGWLNPVLYTLPARDFTDIVPLTLGTGAGVTTLNSDEEYGSGIPGSSTTTGWDLTTGFGVPSADNFVHDLVAALPSAP